MALEENFHATISLSSARGRDCYTNPHISADPRTQNPTRRATVAASTKKLCESLTALDDAETKGTVPLGGPQLDEWRKTKKWYERMDRRP
jgi:hypothetical protein